MRRSIVLLLALALCFLFYLFTEKQRVSVIDAHYDSYTAQIIVDKLPFLNSEKVSWWNKNKNKIGDKYHIPMNENMPSTITIYVFGDGYQEEGKEDRRCFSDIKTPMNCIDKNILMAIDRQRNGSIKYSF